MTLFDLFCIRILEFYGHAPLKSGYEQQHINYASKYICPEGKERDILITDFIKMKFAQKQISLLLGIDETIVETFRKDNKIFWKIDKWDNSDQIILYRLLSEQLSWSNIKEKFGVINLEPLLLRLKYSRLKPFKTVQKIKTTKSTFEKVT